jgi:hypothetical protein
MHAPGTHTLQTNLRMVLLPTATCTRRAKAASYCCVASYVAFSVNISHDTMVYMRSTAEQLHVLCDMQVATGLAAVHKAGGVHGAMDTCQVLIGPGTN